MQKGGRIVLTDSTQVPHLACDKGVIKCYGSPKLPLISTQTVHIFWSILGVRLDMVRNKKLQIEIGKISSPRYV